MTPLDELRVVGLFQLADGEPTGDPPRTWIQVMITGKFKHAKHGPFEITEADLQAYADDIGERADQILIDFDHDSAYGNTKAAGWYTGRTEIKPDGKGRPALFAEIELTPSGAAAVRSKEYRYISPEFSRTFRDAAGKLVKKVRMWATALTNRPFLPDMEPVTLSDVPAAELARGNLTIPIAMQESLADALGLEVEDVLALAEWSTATVNEFPDSSFLYIKPGGEKDGDGKTTPRSLRMFPVKDADGKVDMPHLRNALARIPQSNLPDDVKSRLAAMARRMLDRMGGGGTSADNPDTGTTTTRKDDEVNPEILALLGLPEHADDPTILAALKEREGEIKTLQEQLKAAKADSESVKTLSTRVAELEKEAREREVKLVLEEEVRVGRVLPVEVEHLAESFADNVDGLRALVNSRPPNLFAAARKEHGHGQAGTGDPEVRRVAADIKGDDPVDEDSAKLHLAAVAILKERGKPEGTYTAEDYSSALGEAQTRLAATFA